MSTYIENMSPTERAKALDKARLANERRQERLLRPFDSGSPAYPLFVPPGGEIFYFDDHLAKHKDMKAFFGPVVEKNFYEITHTGGKVLVAADTVVYVLGIGFMVPKHIVSPYSLGTDKGLKRFISVEFVGPKPAVQVYSEHVQVLPTSSPILLLNGISKRREALKRKA